MVLNIVIDTFVMYLHIETIKNLRLVNTKNKSFGLSYYYGAIVNQSTYKLDEIFITYFVNITQ